jgi:hypothetical protein
MKFESRSGARQAGGLCESLCRADSIFVGVLILPIRFGFGTSWRKQ